MLAPLLIQCDAHRKRDTRKLPDQGSQDPGLLLPLQNCLHLDSSSDLGGAEKRAVPRSSGPHRLHSDSNLSEKWQPGGQGRPAIGASASDRRAGFLEAAQVTTALVNVPGEERMRKNNHKFKVWRFALPAGLTVPLSVPRPVAPAPGPPPSHPPPSPPHSPLVGLSPSFLSHWAVT